MGREDPGKISIPAGFQFEYPSGFDLERKQDGPGNLFRAHSALFVGLEDRGLDGFGSGEVARSTSLSASQAERLTARWALVKG